MATFARAIQALQSELSQGGYTLLLACSEYDADQEYQQVRKLIERGVDALLLVGEAHHNDLPELLEKNRIPYVNTFVYNPATHGTCVGPDNRKALLRTHQLSDRARPRGLRRCRPIDRQQRPRAGARCKAFATRSRRSRIAIQPRHFAQGYWGINEGRQLFRRILEKKPWPTAVICGNAYLTVGALLESQAMGIDVPAEMSIVGYDDIEIMASCRSRSRPCACRATKSAAAPRGC